MTEEVRYGSFFERCLVPGPLLSLFLDDQKANNAALPPAPATTMLSAPLQSYSSGVNWAETSETVSQSKPPLRLLIQCSLLSVKKPDRSSSFPSLGNLQEPRIHINDCLIYLFTYLFLKQVYSWLAWKSLHM